MEGIWLLRDRCTPRPLTNLSLSDELYSRSSHFALELVQNADDNEYCADYVPTLRVRLEGSTMIVRCNEKGFTEENVLAICDIAKSTKTSNAGYIGQSYLYPGSFRGPSADTSF